MENTNNKNHFILLALIIFISVTVYFFWIKKVSNNLNVNITKPLKLTKSNELFQSNITNDKPIIININKSNYNQVINSLLDKFKDLDDSKNPKLQYEYSQQSRHFLNDYMKTKLDLSQSKSNIDKYQMNHSTFPPNSTIIIDKSNLTENEIKLLTGLFVNNQIIIK